MAEVAPIGKCLESPDLMCWRTGRALPFRSLARQARQGQEQSGRDRYKSREKDGQSPPLPSSSKSGIEKRSVTSGNRVGATRPSSALLRTTAAGLVATTTCSGGSGGLGHRHLLLDDGQPLGLHHDDCLLGLQARNESESATTKSKDGSGGTK